MPKSRSESTPDHKLPKYTPKKLRLIRDWRARELGSDELNFGSLIIPGLELIELVPKIHVRELAGKLARMFVAVPKEWLPPSAEGGQPAPSPAPDSGPSPSGRSTRSASSVTRTELRLIAVGMTGLACLCGVILGTVLLLRSELQTAFRSARSVRAARDAKVERPAAPPAQRSPGETDEQEPDQVPNRVYSDGASEGTDSAGGKPKRSIKMPKKHYSWQKVAPCDINAGETEVVGGCWQQLEYAHPPCPQYAVEDESGTRCLLPLPAEPKPAKPNSVEPSK